MAGQMMMGQNRSKWRPNSSAAMNNNPQGVQSVMQPSAPPGIQIPLPPVTGGNIARSPLGQSFGMSRESPAITLPPTMSGNIRRSPLGNALGLNQPPAAQAPAQQPASQSPVQMYSGSANGRQPGSGFMPFRSPRASEASQAPQPLASPVAPASRMPLSDAAMPGMEAMVGRWRQRQDAFDSERMQGRDPNSPSQFDVRNVGPGGGYFVDRGGQTKPRLDTSMARNVMAGQPAEGSPNADQPMNIPGATQTLGGRVVSEPQRYGQEGVIPGDLRGMSPMQGAMEGYSPDAFRVGTGGQPMIPYEPSGVAATDGQTARQTTIANRNARARGVRGSDMKMWRALREKQFQNAMSSPESTGSSTGAMVAKDPEIERLRAFDPNRRSATPTQDPAAASQSPAVSANPDPGPNASPEEALKAIQGNKDYREWRRRNPGGIDSDQATSWFRRQLGY